ncbi:MAG TPA: histidine phosphatase family protein [Sphingomicrobium sp.]
MTLLTIMRHAKSSWDDANATDFERPLNERGRKAAERMGRELRSRRFRFDQVIASPAVRVRETVKMLAEGYGEPLDVRFEPQLYGASLGDLLHLVRSIPSAVHAPLLVGHNPGLHELVLALSNDKADDLRGKITGKFPTAAVAVIALPAVRWDEVEPHSGEIRELILPKELD